ncbi:MAG: serine/threonine protein kinase [Nonomuraea sp.]|nr:serine/threonine protein kinase [Nonomuraea sp.]
MPEPLQAGDPPMIGHYHLLSRLGVGGQGVVYLGKGPDGSHVAVKVLHGDISPRTRERFAKELAAARRVDPYAIAQVLDAALDGRPPYIVSEYVQGPSLQQAGIHQGPALQRLAISTATALSAVHKAGIVHRDFKPANVLLALDGPRVIDFGIARDTETSLTVTSSIVGTPAYMAPEQLGGRDIGPPTDVFAWAGVMVFAATGRPPFGNDHLPAVVGRILHAPPDLSGLGEPMRSIVGNCLAKDPARRPGMQEVLLQLLGEVPVRPPQPVALETGPATVPVTRRPTVFIAGAAAVAAVSVTATVVVTQVIMPSRPGTVVQERQGPGATVTNERVVTPEPAENPANKAVVIRSLVASVAQRGGCYPAGVRPKATIRVVDDAEPYVYRWVLDGRETGVTTTYGPKGTFTIPAKSSFASSGPHTAVFKLLRPGTPRSRTITIKVC